MQGRVFLPNVELSVWTWSCIECITDVSSRGTYTWECLSEKVGGLVKVSSWRSKDMKAFYILHLYTIHNVVKDASLDSLCCSLANTFFLFFKLDKPLHNTRESLKLSKFDWDEGQKYT